MGRPDAAADSCSISCAPISPTASGQGIVTVAHPRQAVLGYFAQFFVDSRRPREPYTPTGILGVFAPYGDEFKPENFSYDFDAIELITGRHLEDIHTFVAPNPLPPGPFPDPQPVPGQVVVGKDGRPSFPGTVETWFTMLDHGLQPTGMGTSDAHHTARRRAGLRAHDAVRRRRQGHAGRLHARRRHRGDPRAPRDRDERAVRRDDARHRDDRRHDRACPARPTSRSTCRAPSWAQVDHLIVYTNGGAIVANLPIPHAGQGDRLRHDRAA